MTLKGIIEYWPIITLALAGAVAYGETSMKFRSLEEAQLEQGQMRAKQAEIAAQAARVDERTKAILEAQKTQQRMLEKLLERTK